MIYPAKQKWRYFVTQWRLVDGIQELFIKYKMNGWQEIYAAVKKQLEEYDQWIKDNVLPKGRTDFRLPPEKYKLALESYGIDIPPSEIAKMAHTAFADIQEQMKPLAEQISKKYSLPSNDYRSVIVPEKRSDHWRFHSSFYEAHLAIIEDIRNKSWLLAKPASNY
jgi:hypothetical protein